MKTSPRRKETESSISTKIEIEKEGEQLALEIADEAELEGIGDGTEEADFSNDGEDNDLEENEGYF